MKKGSLEIICGSMFSGKTEELMRRLKRSEFAKQDVLTIKHKIDNRSGYTCISSHNGNKREAHSIENSEESLSKILELVDEKITVIGIDEIQFFPKEIIGVICELVKKGKKVIAAGLDLDFRGEPFGIMPTLLAIADNITKLHAICIQCGDDASISQRIVDGKPAKYNDPIIMVGASEHYEARCRGCFSIDITPSIFSFKQN